MVRHGVVSMLQETMLCGKFLLKFSDHLMDTVWGCQSFTVQRRILKMFVKISSNPEHWWKY